MRKILIIQPYVPEYRREFFTMLAQTLERKNLRLVLCAPEPDKHLSLRKDAAGELSLVQNISVSRVNLFGRRLDFYHLPNGVKFFDFDLVIMEQTLKNVQFAFFAMKIWKIMRFSKKTRFCLWGHGVTIVKKKSKIERWMQLKISKRADYFFAYTESGLRYLVGNGYSQNKIIALGNSNSSRARLKRIDDVKSLGRTSGTQSSIDCCFIGALEESKGIQILVEALPIIKAAIPTFTFTFFGDGPSREIIAQLTSSSSYVSWFGHIEQAAFDRKVAGFSLILNPGRVGLVAVDSLMLKIPIVTLNDGLHAPEFEYIRDNGCSLSVQGDAFAYAQEVIFLLQSPERLDKMMQSCELVREIYTIESMVSNFTTGIFSALKQNEG